MNRTTLTKTLVNALALTLLAVSLFLVTTKQLRRTAHHQGHFVVYDQSIDDGNGSWHHNECPICNP